MTNKKNDCEFSAALTQLIPRLSRYALVLTHNKLDAEDLLQAALLRALDKKSQWREGSDLDRWVFTILSSIWKNKLRARYNRNATQNQAVEELVDPSMKSNPGRTFLLQEVLIQVMSLTEAKRAPMLLVYVEGFSYQEAANILDIPIGTVMSRLARARLILASHFQTETAKPSESSLKDARMNLRIGK